MSAMAPSVCGGAPGAVIGRLRSAFERIDLILRRLHDDRVVHAVFGIEPERRLHLARSGQIDHHAVGDVALGHADILGPRAIDVDVEAGLAERLLDARIDQTGNVAQPAQQLLRVGVILRRDAGPRICTSIGAGAPKFRIWLMMSAGRNENVVPGNRRRQLFAQRLDIFARSAGDPRSSLIWISPSCEPIVPVLL